MASLTEQLRDRIKRWKPRPDLFILEMGFTNKLDEWQLELCRIVASPVVNPGALLRAAIASCAGPGKTWILACLTWWFLVCFGDEKNHPQANATAIDSRNLKYNFWTKVIELHATTPLLQYFFECQAEKIFYKKFPDTWFLAKRTWNKQGQGQEQATGLAGTHTKYSWYVVDESGGVPTAVMKAVLRSLTTRTPGGYNFVIQAGNPTHVTGPLWDAFNIERPLWSTINITADPDDPKRTTRVDAEDARREISIYGRTNPYVMVYILGQFPPASMNALLGPNDVQAAFNREPLLGSYEWAQKRLGADIAFQGDDLTCLFPRQGLCAYDPELVRLDKSSRTFSFDIAARIRQWHETWGQEYTFLDATGGYGDGVYSALAIDHFPVVPVQFSEGATNIKFANKRVEMWWNMAEWVKNGGCLSYTPELVRELTTPTYTLKDGKFWIEPKEMFKKRIGWSPDRADALALTFYWADAPAKTEERLIKKLARANVQKKYSLSEVLKNRGSRTRSRWVPGASFPKAA